MSEPIGTNGPGMKLHTKILIGLAAGGIAGAGANLTLGPDHPVIAAVNEYLAVPVGQVFLRMLFMVVMPLVFASIALGVAGLGDLRRVGRVGGRAIGYFVVTTVLAATLGLIVANLARPWEQVRPETRVALMERFATDASARVDAAATTAQFGPETFVNIVPAQSDRRGGAHRHARRDLLRPDVRSGAHADPVRARTSHDRLARRAQRGGRPHYPVRDAARPLRRGGIDFRRGLSFRDATCSSPWPPSCSRCCSRWPSTSA